MVCERESLFTHTHTHTEYSLLEIISTIIIKITFYHFCYLCIYACVYHKCTYFICTLLYNFNPEKICLQLHRLYSSLLSN